MKTSDLVAERTLHRASGLLHFALGFLRNTFIFQALISGGVANRLFQISCGIIGISLGFVFKFTHK